MTWLERRTSQQLKVDGMISVIKSGQRVYIQPGCIVPNKLVGTLTQRYLELEDVEVLHLLTVGPT